MTPTASLPRPTIAEPPRVTSLDGCAPRFAAAVIRVLAEMRAAGFDPVVAESLRSPARQAYLYGFGRTYDDGRGIVTHVHCSWHTYGLACDIVSARREWDAPDEFWRALGAAAKDEGLVWGGTWTTPDRPHVQWGYPMRQAPSPLAAEIAGARGLLGLWATVAAL